MVCWPPGAAERRVPPAALFAPTTDEVLMLKVGEKAPQFSVKTHTGEILKLSDFAGKTVVLWFYPKADTPG
jgi:peroxiredoxin Q/BCP